MQSVLSSAQHLDARLTLIRVNVNTALCRQRMARAALKSLLTRKWTAKSCSHPPLQFGRGEDKKNRRKKQEKKEWRKTKYMTEKQKCRTAQEVQGTNIITHNCHIYITNIIVLSPKTYCYLFFINQRKRKEKHGLHWLALVPALYQT